MNLSGRIMFGVGMPTVGPVVGATVQIFKEFPGVSPTPVSSQTTTTDATGSFSLPNCDVSLRIGKTFSVSALEATIPANLIVVPEHTIGVPDQNITVPDFKVRVTGITVPGPLGSISVPDFDWTVRGHQFTLTGATTKVPEARLPQRDMKLPVYPPPQNVSVDVLPRLTIRITIAGRNFTNEYPAPPPAGFSAPVPVIMLSDPASLDVNNIGGKDLAVDLFHRAAIDEQRQRYQWAGTPELPRFLASLPANELPPARYLKRATADPIAVANEKVAANQPPNDPLMLSDYAKLAPVIAMVAGVAPKVPDALEDDAAFAAQRVAGVNPLVISCAKSSDIPRVCYLAGAGGRQDTFAYRFLSRYGTSLELAAMQGRLYTCDYSMLNGLNPNGPRFFLAPVALFFMENETRPLIPVGIFLGGNFHAVSNPIFTPASGFMWQVAKLVVQCADLNLHEMKSHLHDTHLVMEAAAVAMHRTMFWGHPVAELLRQHFHIMFFQGKAAREYLMAPEGTVDKALGTGLAGSWRIVERAHSMWSFSAAALENDLSRRNMSLAPLIYPYRDDARQILSAITVFVRNYIRLFYTNDAEVRNDTEIQNWLQEMADPNKANLAGVPTVQTRAELISLVAQIIFTCSAQHSAVNYPQYDYFGLVTNMPAAIWKDPFSMRLSGASSDITKLLPSKSIAVSQIGLAYQLSDYRYDRLGEYWDHTVGRRRYKWLHPQVEPVVTDFRNQLASLQSKMSAINANRPQKLQYPYLLPNNILNSISI